MAVLGSATGTNVSAYGSTVCVNVDAGPLADNGAPYSAIGSVDLSLVRQYGAVNRYPIGRKRTSCEVRMVGIR